MASPGDKWLLAITAALAASCWDGNLDPILGQEGGGDPDADADADSDDGTDTGGDTDSDTGTDTGTEPAACSVGVSLEVAIIVSPWEWYFDVCDFQYDGVCAPDAAGCSGCAWTSGIDGQCPDDQVCCVGEDEVESCVTDWESSLWCGYVPGECADPPTYDEDLEEPVCPGGAFCCGSPEGD